MTDVNKIMRTEADVLGYLKGSSSVKGRYGVGFMVELDLLG